VTGLAASLRCVSAFGVLHEVVRAETSNAYGVARCGLQFEEGMVSCLPAKRAPYYPSPVHGYFVNLPTCLWCIARRDYFSA
jgi:hypothetical protein